MPGERIVDAARDAQLVARVARGDRAALAELYDAYAPVAHSLAVRLVGETRAEDVVHDAFVALSNARVEDSFGVLNTAQLDWLKKDLQGVNHDMPIVVFAHIPLYTVYPA